MLTKETVACIQVKKKSRIAQYLEKDELFKSDPLSRNILDISRLDVPVIAPLEVPIIDFSQQLQVRRKARMVAARKILYGAAWKSLKYCGFRAINKKAGVGIVFKNKAVPDISGKCSVRLTGVGHCGSVHVCPECSSIITENRCASLKSAIETAKKAGMKCSFLTLTIRHRKNQNLYDLILALNAMMTTLRENNRYYKKGAIDLGIGGHVVCREVVWSSKHGWHPHIHILFFHEHQVDQSSLDAWLDKIFIIWAKAAKQQGLSRPLRQCQYIVLGTSAEEKLQSYLTKHGHEPLKPQWAVEREMTKGIHKGSGTLVGMLSPFELLDAMAHTGETKYGQLFTEYALATKGQRQLSWSRGLKDRLRGLGAEIDDRTDTEMVSSDGMLPDEQEICRISNRDLSLLVRYSLLPWLILSLQHNPLPVVVSILCEQARNRESDINRQRFKLNSAATQERKAS